MREGEPISIFSTNGDREKMVEKYDSKGRETFRLVGLCMFKAVEVNSIYTGWDEGICWFIWRCAPFGTGSALVRGISRGVAGQDRAVHVA